MPCYKDDQRGSWYCKFSYQDYTGARRQKFKRGFSTKRDAAAWERTFLETVESSPLRVAFLVLFYTGMRLGELLALTLDDFDAAGQTIRIGKT